MKVNTKSCQAEFNKWVDRGGVITKHQKEIKKAFTSALKKDGHSIRAFCQASIVRSLPSKVFNKTVAEIRSIFANQKVAKGAKKVGKATWLNNTNLPVSWDAAKWQKGPGSPKSKLAFVYKATKQAARSGFVDSKKNTVKVPAAGQSVLHVQPKNAGVSTSKKKPKITFVNADSIDAAKKLLDKGLHPCVLNLANAFSPGGGVASGSKAQEEDLFRRSNYFETLDPKENSSLKKDMRTYLKTPQGIAQDSSRPNAAAGAGRHDYIVPEFGGVFSSGVTIFRHNEQSGYQFTDTPFKLDFLACAAYNRKASHKGKTDNADYGPHNHAKFLHQTEKKIEGLFRICIAHKCSTLVLGAIGCGAFNNDPKEVSTCFANVLAKPEFKNRFDRIVFAILQGPKGRNLTEFQNNAGLKALSR